MSREHKAQRAGDEAAPSPGAVAGKRSLVASRYPALARALGGDAAGEPTIHDAATAAVEHKGGGAPVDPGVAERVGAHLGVDFQGVRVHSEPLAQQATAVMGARAFAHGSDVFLGPGESGGDLGLMAHELTHVAQQGATGQRAVQRALQVGEADSPAERQADQVSAQVTGGQRPAALLVDDGPVGPGQMLKSQFLEQLRVAVTAAADAELGPIYSAIGCPYIEQYFGRYAGRPAASAEALLRRYAPAVGSARAAQDMIPAVVARVREGVERWRDTGEPPPDLADTAEAGAVTGGAAQAQALRARDGGETLASLEAELGPGQALDGSTASRMSAALDVDVSAARIHTGTVAARKAADADALAFAVGRNVVMAAGAPSAGTVEGDALLAHELAHTAQQAGAASDPVARRRPIGAEQAGAEDHADAAAAGTVQRLHGAGGGSLVQRLRSTVRTGLQLQRCPKKGGTAAAWIPATGTKTKTLNGTYGDYEVKYGLTKAPDPSNATSGWGDYDLKITMTPNASTGTSKIAFVQVVRRGQPGGAWHTNASDPFMGAERAKRTDPVSGFKVDRFDATVAKTPFYGMQKTSSGLSESGNVHAGAHGGDQPWMEDAPGVGPNPENAEFVATATDTTSGAQFDAVRWGFTYESSSNTYSEIDPVLVKAGSSEIAGRDRAIKKWNDAVATSGSGIDQVPVTSDPAGVASALNTALNGSTVNAGTVKTTLAAITDADLRLRVAACYQMEVGRKLSDDLKAKLSSTDLTGLTAWTT